MEEELLELVELLRTGAEDGKMSEEMMVAMVKLKDLNRRIHKSIMEASEVIEEKKVNVENSQLKAENLRFKKTTLIREIIRCKDLKTPALNKVESDLDKNLVSYRYNSDLKEQHCFAFDEMDLEFKKRKQEILVLEEKNEKRKELEAKLDEKSTFLHTDLSGKIQQLQSTTESIDFSHVI